MAIEEKPPRSLLELPFEVRQIILKHLLWHRAPLIFDHDLCGLTLNRTQQALWDETKPIKQLHVTILQTCRQVYNEGKEIFDTNIIGCYIGHPAVPVWEPYTAPWVLHRGHGTPLEKLMNSSFKDLSSINIKLFAHQDVDRWRHSLNDLARSMAEVADVLVTAANLQHVEIQVLHTYEDSAPAQETADEEEHATRMAFALMPLQKVRGRTSVTIAGLPEEETEWLSDLMVQKSLV